MIQKHSTSKFATKLKFITNNQTKIIVCFDTNAKWNAFKMKKVANTGINKLNWRFNHMFSDHKPGLLLYVNLLDYK